MNNVIFLFEAFNPNKRSTFFKHKSYANYLAYSEFAIRNPKTEHGLFGKIKDFSNIENMESIEPINQYIIKLVDKKVPIYRCTISLDEYDAIRLGYDTQEKWKGLFESKLVSFAKKMNVKYEDLQYVGAVHLESGHPHFQIMLWSKQRDKMNYYINYGKINKMRDEFTNAIFREDLIELYKEKDLARKGIIEKNVLLQKLKKVNKDSKFIKEMVQYEKDFSNKKIMRNPIKNKELRKIAGELLKLKEQLRNTKGSIKYQYLKRYPVIIKQVDIISKSIIESSLDTQIEIEKYILAKQKIVSFKFQEQDKIQKAQQEEKVKAEDEIIKLIGNQILNFERVLLNQKIEYTKSVYYNETESLIWRIFNCVYFSTRQEEKYLKNFEIKYKKQLSKQAEKDLAINKANASSFHWDI